MTASASSPFIASARMYSVDPHTARSWRALLEWIAARAGVALDVIDYPPPLPLSALWARGDLGAVFMCGLPYSLADPAPQLIAAPVPSPSRYRGLPRYMTDLVVRADSGAMRIDDTFGGVAGYTVDDSQSGHFAFRHFLAQHRREPDGQRDAPLYRAVVGNLINARGVIEALAAGRIDVGPLDSYYHDLLIRHQREFAAQVRTIATTEPTPIPVFVASRSLPGSDVARLRRAFIDAGTADEIAPIRSDLLIDRFVVPDPADYQVLRSRRAAIIAAPELW